MSRSGLYDDIVGEPTGLYDDIVAPRNPKKAVAKPSFFGSMRESLDSIRKKYEPAPKPVPNPKQYSRPAGPETARKSLLRGHAKELHPDWGEGEIAQQVKRWESTKSMTGKHATVADEVIALKDPKSAYNQSTSKDVAKQVGGFMEGVNEKIANVIGGSALFGAYGDYQSRTMNPKKREEAFTEQGMPIAQMLPTGTIEQAAKGDPLAVLSALGVPGSILGVRKLLQSFKAGTIGIKEFEREAAKFKPKELEGYDPGKTPNIKSGVPAMVPTPSGVSQKAKREVKPVVESAPTPPKATPESSKGAKEAGAPDVEAVLKASGSQLDPDGIGHMITPGGLGVKTKQSVRGGFDNHWEVAADAGLIPNEWRLAKEGPPVSTQSIVSGMLRDGWIRWKGDSNFEFWGKTSNNLKTLEKRLDGQGIPPSRTIYLDDAQDGISYSFTGEDYAASGYNLSKTLARAKQTPYNAAPPLDFTKYRAQKPTPKPLESIGGPPREIPLSKPTGEIPKVNPKKVAEAPKVETPESPKVEEPKVDGNATGLANQVQTREAEAGLLREVEATAGKSPEEWQKIGKEKFGDDYDSEGLAERIARGEEELTGEKVGILLEGKRRLVNDVNNAAKRLAENPKDKSARASLDHAEERLQNYVENVQVGKGRWSDVGRALQAGTGLDEGNFASVLERATRRTDKDPSGYWKTETQKLTDEVAKRDKEIADLKAGRQTVRTVKTKLNKDAIIKEIDDIANEWAGIRPSKNPKVTKQTGAILINKQDIVNLGKRGELIVRYVKAHAKLGAANVEEFVKTVKVAALQKLGVEIDDQLIIDLAAETTGRKTQTQLQKDAASLKAKLKTASSKGQDARATELERQIAEAKAQLDSGNFGPQTKAERVVTERIKKLEAERDIYAAKVRSQIRAHEQTLGGKIVRGAAQTVRGAQLGADIGILTRQGLFSISRPVAYAKGLGNAAKSVFSEQNLARIERNLDEREINGVKAIVEEKKAGLQRTTHFGGPDANEELTLAKLAEYFPELLGKGLDKIGLKPVGTAVRTTGKAVGGSLARAQSAFINTVRANTFDRAIARGYSADELAHRARFINNATGRGNMKSVPAAAQVIFTSPRYEASRWAMLAEPLRNPGRVIADLVKGRGYNRGAAANIQDLAVTAAEVYGVYKLAELAGYEVDFEPTSADFLKMRKGDEVWDPTAGIAPRLRDVMRIAAFYKDPDYRKTITDIAGKATVRSISPAIKTPIEQSSLYIQKRRGVSEPKSPFSGYVSEEDEMGWIAFAPLIGQSFWKTLQEEDLNAALSAAMREFVGQSVNRYPKPNPKK